MNIAQINNSTIEELESIADELNDEAWIAVFTRMKELLIMRIYEAESESAASAYERGLIDGRKEAKAEAIDAIKSI